MSKKIVVVCDNTQCAKVLEETSKNLDINIKCEVQQGTKITNEVSINEIKESTAVLFAINGTVEEIEKIERFIDFEYYEVEPRFILEDAKNVLMEILSDIN